MMGNALLFRRFTTVAISLLGAFYTVHSCLPSSSNQSQLRQLRFLDPDHRTCGNDRLAHLFALHYLYGAKRSEEGYYTRRTISTIQEIPEDKGKINHILQVLSYVARKLDRPIRVNKAVLSGYNSEHRQGYSLVHAVNLKSVAVDVVEMNYWNRAVVAQETIKTARNITLGDSPLDMLTRLTNEEDAHELLFDIDELAAVDVHKIGRLTGAEGGYEDGAWKVHFACFEEHPSPTAIPPANDPLSK